MSKEIRAIIVDDEPFARQGIRRELERSGSMKIIAECANGRAAVKAIQEQRPDLVLLDLQMPELDGFGVVEAVGVEQMPVVIFITAYDQFALKAFESQALDYILKPFDSERFQKALRRAEKRIEQGSLEGFNSRLIGLLEAAANHSDSSIFLERVVVRKSGKIFFLSVNDIDWIEAEDNYVRLHVGTESHLVHGTLSGLEATLDPGRFLRVHRSTMMNLSRVKDLQPMFHGEYAILLENGTRLTSSRSYKDKLRNFLENAF